VLSHAKKVEPSKCLLVARYGGLANWILYNFCNQFSGPVYAVFDTSVPEGTVPDSQKEASDIPVAPNA